MNILHFCQLYFPAIYGGGEYIFFQWAKELVGRGHKVFVITQRLKGEKDFGTIDGINVYRVGPAIEYRGTLPLNILENLGYVVGAVVKGVMLIVKNKIGIIHSNTYAPALAGQICAIISRKPHIITVHDVYYLTMKGFWDKWASHTSVGSLAAKIGPCIEKLVLKLPATVFHTVSETSKHDLYLCGLQKVVVIPNGIDLQGYDSISATKVNAHQAIFIGRLVFYKNLDTVIRAMKDVVAKIPNTKLIVVGDGPMLSSMERLTKNLGLAGNVIFKGKISHEEKVKLLKRSSFLLLPSLVEGFGIVVLEAYAHKKPVLTSNVMPLPEIVEDGVTGFTIQPFNTESWADSMVYLFENPSKAREMGLMAYEVLKKNYTIERIVDQLEETYLELIKDV